MKSYNRNMLNFRSLSVVSWFILYHHSLKVNLRSDHETISTVPMISKNPYFITSHPPEAEVESLAHIKGIDTHHREDIWITGTIVFLTDGTFYTSSSNFIIIE